VDIVPFLVEDMLITNVLIYSKRDDCEEYVVKYGLLITGQNLAFSKLVVETLLDFLNKFFILYKIKATEIL